MTPFALYQEAEDEKPFWLSELTEGGWQPASQIAANRPYIICMPNNWSYDEAYNVAGTVTFSAKGVTMPKTEAATSIGGSAYRFVPVTLNTKQADSVFALNVGEAYTAEDGRRYPEGSVFVRGLRAALPFEGYITAADAGAKVRYIPIGQDAATGMDDVRWSMYDGRWTMCRVARRIMT